MNNQTSLDRVTPGPTVPPPADFVPLAPTSTDTLTGCFARQARARPEQAAVITRNIEWTYADLDRRATAIANRILELAGDGPGRVGLLFGQEPIMIAAVIGTLRAGKAYLPLDGSYPPERLRFMLADAGVELVVVADHLRALASAIVPPGIATVDAESLTKSAARVDSQRPALTIPPDRPAYVLYTSGSTGRPKGVMQTHRNVLHHMAVWTNNLKIAASDRMSLQSAYGWDSAVQDTFGALLNGATLYPVSPKDQGLDSVLDWYLRNHISVHHSTLPIFRGLAKAARANGHKWNELRVGALGGDPIHRTDVELFFAVAGPHARLVNAYGATESSSALLQVIGPGTNITGEVVPLGRPVDRTEVLLVGDDGHELEGAAEGEIVLRSAFVASYWGAAADEPSRIVADRADQRLVRYHSGDLARRDESGSFQLMGRKDFQVKIRGIRVELGEIEGVLKRHAAVEDAVVTAREDKNHDRELVAHWVARVGNQATVEDLRAFLLERLPDHAVPGRFVLLPSLPLTPNGKVDRKALPDAGRARPVLGTNYVAPASRAERVIAEIWKEVLGLEQVGVDDNFFDLGGNSLRVATVNQLVRSRVGKSLTMVAMYRAPTIRSLAQALDDGASANAAAREMAERAGRRADLRRQAMGGLSRRRP